jgi:sarcosine oxidase delta subunit
LTNKQEIKCPHCHKWTLWQGHIDDRCLYCGEFLEIENFTKSVETKIKREVKKEEDFLFVRDEDSPFVKKLKTRLRPIRRIIFYFQLGFVAFISILFWIIGFVTA